MTKKFGLVAFFIGFLAATSFASPDGTSIAIKFAVDEPLVSGESDEESNVDGPAGVLKTAVWNNFELLTGEESGLVADVNGTSTATNASVEWTSANTWSSSGRGTENTNDAEDGNDRRLMLGYLDNNPDVPVDIIVDGLGEDFTGPGYDVYVYIQGGVLDRGGEYTIGDTTIEHTVLEFFEGDFVEGSEGNYLVFPELSDASFELSAVATIGATMRAPVNAIEIVSRGGGGVVGDGDFNNDGVLDVMDIDALTVESGSGNNGAAFDLTGDGLVNAADVTKWAVDLKGTWIGDANLDGEFSSSDFVQVFQGGLFETGQPSTWSTGDWNGDGVFSSGDFVAAFQDGGFEMGPRGAVASVPEPSSIVLLAIGFLGLVMRRRR